MAKFATSSIRVKVNSENEWVRIDFQDVIKPIIHKSQENIIKINLL